MKMNKNGTGVATFTFWSFFIILAIIGVFFIGGSVIKWAVAEWGHLGSGSSNAALDIPVSIPSWLGGSTTQGILNWIFSPGESLSWQMLLISVIIFVMLAVAFTDILVSFSTFRGNTANYLGIGLAFLALFTGVVRGLLVWFGLTAGIGAVGIGIVFIGAILVFVATNLLIGKRAIHAMRTARDLDNLAIEAQNTKLAFAGARMDVDAINEARKAANKANNKSTP
jgi:hypothetical protein